MVDKIAVGRRKTSVARVVIRPGSGKIVINDKDINEYFPTKFDTLKATEPLKVVDAQGKYDFLINVQGGGITGQVWCCFTWNCKSISVGQSRLSTNIKKIRISHSRSSNGRKKEIRPTKSSKKIPILETIILN